MRELWEVYHDEMPAFLREFSNTPPMLRLQKIGMNCGCEYTSFPMFSRLQSYSRYDHSVGTALIVWHFTHSREQALAALFHDVTTPCFAHVVDFLNGDHLRQESTEAGVAECLVFSKQVCDLLEKYGLTVVQVSDYHRFPVADNASPALSADRLEYTMGNLRNYRLAAPQQLREFYEDLTVGKDEAGNPELVFQTPAVALAFTKAALKTSHIYIADEDRFAMQALADLLKLALERKVLSREDLEQTEQFVIDRLRQDPICAAQWDVFCRYSRVLRCEKRPETGYWVCVGAKKRWIDPLAKDRGRVSRWDSAVRMEIEQLQALDFSYWISAE